jgi:hypothetical protein
MPVNLPHLICIKAQSDCIVYMLQFDFYKESRVMSLTNYFAEFIGIYIAIMCAVMIVRKQAMLEIMAAFVDQHPLMFILAMLRILIGLGVVIAHNRWSGALATAVTFMGWITLLRGIALMLVPQQTERRVLEVFKQPGPYYGAASVGIVLGLWLAFAGFAG